MSMTAEKQLKIDALISTCEKNHGKGTIQYGERPIEKIPLVCGSGSLKLDTALGIGGIPRGRIIEIYGGESAGKTTLTLSIIAECQKADGVCAFIDAEHALDRVWATKIGVKTNNLLISQPDCGEEALTIVENCVDSGVVDLVIVDSVACLTPKAEIDGEMGDSHMGLQARLMSQALRKLTGKISKSKCTVIFINQIRHKIGVMFGSPETTTGGNALKFYASIRMEMRNDSEKDLSDEFGQRSKAVKIKIVKNKVAPPFKVANVILNTNEEKRIYGFNNYVEVIDLGADFGIIKKSGTWYSYKEEKLGQGKENVAEYLRQNSSMYEEIKKQVVDKLAITDLDEVGSFSSAIADAVENNTKVKKRRGETPVEVKTEEVIEAETVEEN